MRKAVFAGAVALAMIGSLFVSEKGIGPASAAAQEIALTQGHIYRLNALRLTGEQLHLWRPVEAALHAAIRESQARLEQRRLGAAGAHARKGLCGACGQSAACDVGGRAADQQPRREPAAQWPERHPLDGRRLDVLRQAARRSAATSST